LNLRPGANGTSACSLPLAFLSPRIIAETQTPETNAQDTHRTSAKEPAEAADFVPASA
jgi:hypothetical protein